MLRILVRLGLGILPLALTPLLGFLIAEGYLDFGGGEKDLSLLVPWLFWSLVYLMFSFVSWWRRVSITIGLAYSAGGATGVLALAYLVMLVWFSGWLGVSPP